MRKSIVALLALMPTVANATQASVLCKTDQTNEYIDIVAKGEQTSDVLVQVNGGKFYDGHSMLMNNVLIVTVDFVGGGLMLNTGANGKGSLLISVNDKSDSYSITCNFRK